MDMYPSPEDLKYLILNATAPMLFKRCISSWPLLNFDLQNWSNQFNEKLLPIRVGCKMDSNQQWERSCKTEQLRFDDFLKKYIGHEDNWAYFDYKYMHEWFSEGMEEAYNWGVFGFESCKGEESTLWIGTSGAHTPCHYDAYSCNLVAQVYGQKRWILIPPDNEKKYSKVMKPCRVPYEESSIYSKLNFYSPANVNEFKDIKNAIVVTLQPGDVLFVPKHWWHFVENIDLVAISINTWISLASDNENRVEESLVRTVVGALIQSPNLDKDQILNPNEGNQFFDLSQNLLFLKQSVTKLSESKNATEKYIVKQNEKYEEIIKKFSEFIEVLPATIPSEFMKILEENSKRYLEIDDLTDNVKTDDDMIKCVINSFCHPKVIDLVKEIFMNEYLK